MCSLVREHGVDENWNECLLACVHCGGTRSRWFGVQVFGVGLPPLSERSLSWYIYIRKSGRQLYFLVMRILSAAVEIFLFLMASHFIAMIYGFYQPETKGSPKDTCNEPSSSRCFATHPPQTNPFAVPRVAFTLRTLRVTLTASPSHPPPAARALLVP